MGQFGESLRRERETRGIALETISSVTKIATRYLSALEQEQFEVLPGGILAKGIVRGYARAVGLDEVTWVDWFLAAASERGLVCMRENWVDFASKVAESRPRTQARSGHPLRWVAVAALLVLLAGLGTYVWRHRADRVEAKDLQTPPAAAASVTPPSGQ